VILAIDVGNTETVLGVLDGLETIRSWRLATERGRTSDELGLLVRGFLDGDGLPEARPAGAVVASVVPVLARWASRPSS
jgi:type III pantothenate kinase